MEMRQPGRQAGGVFGRLRFDAGERMAFGLGFDGADGLGIGVEQIGGKAGVQRELPHSHAAASGDIHSSADCTAQPVA